MHYRNILNCLFYLFVTLLTPLVVNSQSNVTFRQLSVKEGLSQNSVVSIAQDSIGFIWFATQDGLNKYDGKKFTIYNQYFVDITKPDYSFLGKIYLDKENRLWSLPINRIPHFYDLDSDSFIEYEKINDVSAIFQDNQLNLWFGTYSLGLFKKSKDTGEILQVLNSNETGTIFNITEGPSGDIWISTNSKLIQIDRETLNHTIYNPHKNSYEVNYSDVVFDKGGNQWVGSFGEGLWFRKNGESDFTAVQDLGFKFQRIPDNLYVLDLFVDSKERLWMGTYGNGLIKFNPNDSTINQYTIRKHDPRAIHYNDILSIYEDYTGTIWFGTDGAGVSYYDEYLEKFNSFTNNQTPEGVNIDVVRAITIDQKNNIWIGTSGKGLTKYSVDSGNWHTFLIENSSLKSNRIMSLITDTENDIWIGTQERGLQIMTTDESFNEIKLSDENIIKNSTIWNIFQDSKDQIWLATRDMGIFQYDKREGIQKHFMKHPDFSGLPTNNIRVIIEKNKDHLWLGTEEDGVILLNTETGNHKVYGYSPAEKKGLNTNGIKSLYYDEVLDRLWVGTNGGGLNVIDLNSDSYYYYTTEYGLSNNVIYAILPDELGDLWLSSNKGITKFSPPKNLLDTLHIKNYANYDGLATEFNTGAYFKAKNGNLYFGGLEGFYWFNPSYIFENDIIVKTAITGFEVYNDPVDLVQHTVLKHNQNTISFTFSSLQYALPQKNQFQYRLDGYEEKWIFSGNMDYARYTNLPPGEYAFYVKSSNYDGIWNHTPEVFYFSILNPWYKTRLAYLFYIFLFFFLMFLIYSYFKWKWQMQLELKMEYDRSERLKQLNEYKTRLYTNLSHEFRTPLTLISAPIKKHLKNEALPIDAKNDLMLVERNSTLLINLVNQLLELSKLETGNINLKVSNENLKLLLKSITASFIPIATQKPVSLKIQINTPQFAWIDVDAIEKIINNLMTNALKYAPIKSEILFEATVKNNHLIVTITNENEESKTIDLQKYFERFYQENSEKEGFGIGLSLVKELTTLHHGTVRASQNDKNQITFTLEIPITKESFAAHELKPIDAVQNNEESQFSIPEYDTSTPSNNIILIVEDNKDLRHFLKSLFINQYKVLEAENGDEGIKKALQNIPDLIISDIMMPKTDGIQLCKTLKEDEKTSHIPIILLTAKSSEEFELKGLKTGADDYILKPFNPEKIIIRVQKLIEIRNNLKNRYQQNVLLKPKDIAITSTDEKFFKRLQKILDINLTNPAFNAESFSKETGMSRMQLHRKLNALTGLSTSNFIKSQRLKLALQLLKNSDYTISEIAYESGFNSPSYFIKSFKEVYGKPPSEYMKG
ncbi:MAG: two-component regulator propeller domain-containing protein [Flavobacteriaceae bacterium]